MVEVEFPHGWNPPEGHMPEVRDVLLDLYRLATIYLADENLYAISRSTLMPDWVDEDWNDPIDDPLVQLAAEYEWREITRILISSAATGRILDDRDQRRLEDPRTRCGQLIPDLGRPNEDEPLTLRESFNKIIHARRIRSDRAQDENGQLMHQLPVVHFYGTRNGVDWKATLWISDYVRQFVLNLGNA